MRWLFAPMPLGRVAALRTLVYLFVPVDVLLTTSWVQGHADVPGELYRPLVIGQWLHLPTPTHLLVETVKWLLLLTTLAAATGRAPRLFGGTVAVLYLEWMVIAMSYGKVDHDRFAFLVALFVLPTVGRARHGDPERSEAAGWALRAVQVSVVCTYFFAAWAKLRFGGLEWLTGATLARAVLRRGTSLADWTLDVPYLLVGFQFVMVTFELLSPVVLLVRSERVRYALVAGLYGFHAMTYAAIRIIFLPHLVAMTAFLPLERLRPVERARAAWSRRGIPRRRMPVTSRGSVDIAAASQSPTP